MSHFLMKWALEIAFLFASLIPCSINFLNYYSFFKFSIVVNSIPYFFRTEIASGVNFCKGAPFLSISCFKQRRITKNFL
jgi:hypothetical protein